MELNIYKDSEELSHELAHWMVQYIAATLKKQERFTLVLSGGSTPEKLHGILAASPIKEQIDWAKIHIFWGDERYVSFEDKRNNARMAYETLLNFVPIPSEQIHIINTRIAPDASAKEYEKQLHHYFHADSPSFDLVLLGMGDDGHTLSLFPGMAVVHETRQLTLAYYLEAQEMYRITLTAPIVNRAKRIAFLVCGTSKAIALKEVIEGAFRPEEYPAQIIQPKEGELFWFVDEAAAELLK